MSARAPGRSERRAGWTLVLFAAAFFALVPTFGLVSRRSRAAAEPAGENVSSPQHEPPPSGLVAPRPAAGANASGDDTSGRKSAHEAEDAAPEPVTLEPASTKHAPDRAALEVRVTDAGRAAPLARVELVCAAGGERPELYTADEQGLVRLELAPGKVRAAAWSDGACALPASATLVAGACARLELALEPAFPVAGRVIDARTGAPIEGAEVALWTFAERDTVTTASDGTFRHPRFPANAPAQQLAARAAGYGVSVRYLRIDPGGAWKISARTSEEESVRGTGTPWVELALVPELVVRGRVLDDGGRPLADARVAAEGYFHALASVATRDAAETRSDAAGAFELRGLRSDIGHSLLVEAQGFAAALRELEPALESIDAGELVLARETILAGAVVGPDGLPVAEAEVVLHLDGGARAPRAPDSLDVDARLQGCERRARTDQFGTFVFEKLAPRPVVLQVEHGAGLSARVELEPRADGSFEPPCLALALHADAPARERR